MRLAMPDMDLVTFNEMADAVESCIAAAELCMRLGDEVIRRRGEPSIQ